jgi:PleD family two-component response regulator
MVTMKIDTESVESLPPKRPLRTVAVVSRQPHVAVLDSVLDAGGYDVVFMESVGHAYSQIRSAAPDMVILCLDIDDAESFQILTMLKMDEATSNIPVVTYVDVEAETESAEQSLELDREAFSPRVILSMN